MKYILITGLFISAALQAKEAPLFAVKHLPSTKTLAEILPSQCNHKAQVLGEAKALNFKCLVLKNEKFFTLFEGEKELMTVRGTVEEGRSLKNSATVGLRTDQLEVIF